MKRVLWVSIAIGIGMVVLELLACETSLAFLIFPYCLWTISLSFSLEGFFTYVVLFMALGYGGEILVARHDKTNGALKLILLYNIIIGTPMFLFLLLAMLTTDIASEGPIPRWIAPLAPFASFLGSFLAWKLQRKSSVNQQPVR